MLDFVDSRALRAAIPTAGTRVKSDADMRNRGPLSTTVAATADMAIGASAKRLPHFAPGDESLLAQERSTDSAQAVVRALAMTLKRMVDPQASASRQRQARHAIMLSTTVVADRSGHRAAIDGTLSPRAAELGLLFVQLRRTSLQPAMAFSERCRRRLLERLMADARGRLSLRHVEAPIKHNKADKQQGVRFMASAFLTTFAQLGQVRCHWLQCVPLLSLVGRSTRKVKQQGASGRSQ